MREQKVTAMLGQILISIFQIKGSPYFDFSNLSPANDLCVYIYIYTYLLNNTMFSLLFLLLKVPERSHRQSFN